VIWGRWRLVFHSLLLDVLMLICCAGLDTSCLIFSARSFALACLRVATHAYLAHSFTTAKAKLIIYPLHSHSFSLTCPGVKDVVVSYLGWSHNDSRAYEIAFLFVVDGFMIRLDTSCCIRSGLVRR
jgi:hypothetical protein